MEMDERKELIEYIREEQEIEARLQREKERIESDLNHCRSKQNRYKNRLFALESR